MSLQKIAVRKAGSVPAAHLSGGGERCQSPTKPKCDRQQFRMKSIHSKKIGFGNIFSDPFRRTHPVERETVGMNETISQYRSLYAQAHKRKSHVQPCSWISVIFSWFLVILSACEFVNMEPRMSIFNIFQRELPS